MKKEIILCIEKENRIMYNSVANNLIFKYFLSIEHIWRIYGVFIAIKTEIHILFSVPNNSITWIFHRKILTLTNLELNFFIAYYKKW